MLAVKRRYLTFLPSTATPIDQEDQQLVPFGKLLLEAHKYAWCSNDDLTCDVWKLHKANNL